MLKNSKKRISKAHRQCKEVFVVFKHKTLRKACCNSLDDHLIQSKQDYSHLELKNHQSILMQFHKAQFAKTSLHLKYSSIAFAAIFPAPIAEITVAAPVTASPPA